MANLGLKITSFLADVFSASSRQFIFNSRFVPPIIYKFGTIVITVPANTSTQTLFSATIDFNLKYIPIISIFPSDGTMGGSINFVQPSGSPSSEGTIDRFQYSYDLQPGTITVYAKTSDALFFPNGSAITLTFKYYIFTQKMA